jgi:hypothetical protein
LINLRELRLYKNQLKSLPSAILNVKNILQIDETSYQINNLDMESEILIFYILNKQLTNLPTSLKQLWIKQDRCSNHKLPFGCELKYY